MEPEAGPESCPADPDMPEAVHVDKSPADFKMPKEDAFLCPRPKRRLPIGPLAKSGSAACGATPKVMPKSPEVMPKSHGQGLFFSMCWRGFSC